MTGLLLRLYPRAWRVRYGAELEDLILASSDGRVSWRVRLDVAAGALRERLRAAGLAGDPPPAERARGGVLLVLCSWALFVVGGVGVQKFSEHWQAATPAADRALPAGSFDSLFVIAVVASALVVTGTALALPAFVQLLRDGGWPLVRGRLVAAVTLTVVAGGFLAGLATWGHRLTESQRNGGDHAYIGLGVVTLLLLLACLAAWTAAAVACARRVHLSRRLLTAEAALATAVAVSMAAMTVATALWWAALARTAQPSFFGGASPVAPQLLVATALMLAATASGAIGARQALRGAR